MDRLSDGGNQLFRPRTFFGGFLLFLVASFCWLLVVGAGAAVVIFAAERLGFDKPKLTLVAPLFWLALYFQWKAVVPSKKVRQAYREEKEAKDRMQKEQSLEQAATYGDTKASLKLGHLYRDGVGAPKNLTQALKHYDRAAMAGVESAKRAAANIRQELD